MNTKDLPMTVEVQSLDDLDVALEMGVTGILLDHFDNATLVEAVKRARKAEVKPHLEASGNMTLERIRSVAETGVDFISVGALTHSAPAPDLSLLIHR